MPLDEIRAAFWQGVSEAFPANVEVSQTDEGHLLVGLPMPTPERANRRGREVLIVLQRDAIKRMTGADAALRRGIAQAARDSVVRALRGYDPDGPLVPSYHIYLDEPELGY
jgi:hypothetical protein